MKKTFTIISIFISSLTFAQNGWQTMTTAEDICNAYPKVIEKMFSEFNLDRSGLEEVKAALLKADTVNACYSLLEYYSNSESNAAIELGHEQPRSSNRIVSEADTILNNIFEIQCVKGKVPYLNNGHRDWNYPGPNKDLAWAWISNRHEYLEDVLDAYYKTGNDKYVEFIDLFLRDFITASLPYPGVKSHTLIWRGLEVSFRAKVWSNIFYGLIDNPHFSDASRLLILSSLPDHAHYNRNFHASNNWLTMEISALAAVASNFPEYKRSEEWLTYAVNTMTKSMPEQVYPDGVQKELTCHYHYVSLANFIELKHYCDNANVTVPKAFIETVENMTTYMANMLRPDGNGLLNNDSDLDYLADYIIDQSDEFNRDDWKYIATHGKKGVEPAEGPSFVHGYSGHFVSRNNYSKNAQWSFFDIGPDGLAHVHHDKLHISVSAYGRDLLVDGGRFAYDGEIYKKFRGYAIGTASHNTLLINGRGHNVGPAAVEAPLNDNLYKITSEYDYATSTAPTFSGVDQATKHTRAVMYVRDEFWVIVDRIETKKPCSVNALWHWHPNCEVKIDDNSVKTANRRGNLSITPVTDQLFDIEKISGQDSPVQGWYCPEYNSYMPNVVSVYNTNIDDSSTIVWLLVPSKRKKNNIIATIISENDNEVKVMVDGKSESWNITMPYFNNENVNLEIN